MQMFTPREYLKIDVANSFGLDKKDWGERIEWFDSNEHRLAKLLPEAENCAQFYAGTRAWEEARAGRPTGYGISLDATSSGIQILSALTGDRKAALLSNVLDSGHRSDAYTALFEAMKRVVAERSGVVGAKFLRKQLKDAVMTAFYGSEKVPKDLFGEGALLQAFFDTLEAETPFAWEINKYFLQIWDPTASNYSWVMPDNFHVNTKVTDVIDENVRCMGQVVTTQRTVNKPKARGKSLGANVIHSVDGMIVRELGRRCDFDPATRDFVQALIIEGPTGLENEESADTAMVRKLWRHREETGFLSARILDHLGGENIHLVNTDDLQDLLDSLPARPFKVATVHDCFKVHPNYGDDLRRQYNNQLSMISGSTMLSSLLTQVTGRSTQIRKQAEMAEEVLHADYALS